MSDIAIPLELYSTLEAELVNRWDDGFTEGYNEAFERYSTRIAELEAERDKMIAKTEKMQGVLNTLYQANGELEAVVARLKTEDDEQTNLRIKAYELGRRDERAAQEHNPARFPHCEPAVEPGPSPSAEVPVPLVLQKDKP